LKKPNARLPQSGGRRKPRIHGFYRAGQVVPAGSAWRGDGDKKLKAVVVRAPKINLARPAEFLELSKGVLDYIKVRADIRFPAL